MAGLELEAPPPKKSSSSSNEKLVVVVAVLLGTGAALPAGWLALATLFLGPSRSSSIPRRLIPPPPDEVEGLATEEGGREDFARPFIPRLRPSRSDAREEGAGGREATGGLEAELALSETVARLGPTLDEPVGAPTMMGGGGGGAKASAVMDTAAASSAASCSLGRPRNCTRVVTVVVVLWLLSGGGGGSVGASVPTLEPREEPGGAKGPAKGIRSSPSESTSLTLLTEGPVYSYPEGEKREATRAMRVAWSGSAVALLAAASAAAASR